MIQYEDLDEKSADEKKGLFYGLCDLASSDGYKMQFNMRDGHGGMIEDITMKPKAYGEKILDGTLCGLQVNYRENNISAYFVTNSKAGDKQASFEAPLDARSFSDISNLVAEVTGIKIRQNGLSDLEDISVYLGSD